MKSTLNDVSIVIVTYKGDDMTRNCLDSLAAVSGKAKKAIDAF